MQGSNIHPYFQERHAMVNINPQVESMADQIRIERTKDNPFASREPWAKLPEASKPFWRNLAQTRLASTPGQLDARLEAAARAMHSAAHRDAQPNSWTEIPEVTRAYYRHLASPVLEAVDLIDELRQPVIADITPIAVDLDVFRSTGIIQAA
jgi:hypothetical protein